jgi:hypothetical protein
VIAPGRSSPASFAQLIGTCLRGLLGALAGAALGGLVSSFCDARLAAAVTGTAGLLAPSIGLIAPLALPIAGLAFGVRALFLGAEAWSARQFWRSLEARSGSARALWVTTPPLLALALPLGLVMLAGVAARLLGADARGPAALALLPLACLPLLLALLGGVRALGAALAERAGETRVGPGLSLALSGAALSGCLALLIALGETGGGGGAFGILGVLRRQELDLRAPGLLLMMLAAALLFPSPRGALSLALSAACVVLPG